MIKTYNISEDIAQKFKNQTPARKTSAELEKLMAEYVDEDITVQDKQPLFDISELTRKRKKLLKTLLNEKMFGSNYLTIKKKINSKHGIYQRKDHFKQALKVLTKTLPIKKDGKIVEVESFECDDCRDQINLSEVSDLQGDCLCGRKIIEL